MRPTTKPPKRGPWEPKPPVRVVALLLLATVLAGCYDNREMAYPQYAAQSIAKWTQVGDDVLLTEVRLEGGTRCVVAAGRSGNVALSCDWSGRE